MELAKTIIGIVLVITIAMAVMYSVVKIINRPRKNLDIWYVNGQQCETEEQAKELAKLLAKYGYPVKARKPDMDEVDANVIWELEQ